MANQKIKVIQVTGINIFDTLYPEIKVGQLRQSDNPANGLSTVADYMLDTLIAPTLITKWLKVNANGTASYIEDAAMIGDIGANEAVHGHKISDITVSGPTNLESILDTKVPLDEFGKIVDSYFPEAVKGAVKFLGFFNSNITTNTAFNAALAAKGFAAMDSTNWQKYQGMFIEATASFLTVTVGANDKFWSGEDALLPTSMIVEAGDQLVFNQYANSTFQFAVRNNQIQVASAAHRGIVTVSDPTGKQLATLSTIAQDGDKVIDEAFLREVMKDILYIVPIAFPADVRRAISTIPTGNTVGTNGEYVFCFQDNRVYLCTGGTSPNVSWSNIAPVTLPASEIDGFSPDKLYHNTVANKYLVPTFYSKNTPLIESIPLVNDLAFIQQ